MKTVNVVLSFTSTTFNNSVQLYYKQRIGFYKHCGGICAQLLHLGQKTVAFKLLEGISWDTKSWWPLMEELNIFLIIKRNLHPYDISGNKGFSTQNTLGLYFVNSFAQCWNSSYEYFRCSIYVNWHLHINIYIYIYIFIHIYIYIYIK